MTGRNRKGQACGQCARLGRPCGQCRGGVNPVAVVSSVAAAAEAEQAPVPAIGGYTPDQVRDLIGHGFSESTLAMVERRQDWGGSSTGSMMRRAAQAGVSDREVRRVLAAPDLGVADYVTARERGIGHDAYLAVSSLGRDTEYGFSRWTEEPGWALQTATHDELVDAHERGLSAQRYVRDRTWGCGHDEAAGLNTASDIKVEAFLKVVRDVDDPEERSERFDFVDSLTSADCGKIREYGRAITAGEWIHANTRGFPPTVYGPVHMATDYAPGEQVHAAALTVLERFDGVAGWTPERYVEGKNTRVRHDDMLAAQANRTPADGYLTARGSGQDHAGATRHASGDVAPPTRSQQETAAAVTDAFSSFHGTVRTTVGPSPVGDAADNEVHVTLTGKRHHLAAVIGEPGDGGFPPAATVTWTDPDDPLIAEQQLYETDTHRTIDGFIHIPGDQITVTLWRTTTDHANQMTKGPAQ